MNNFSNKMFVSGFTFIRNALKFDYPVVESITSILPLCDEFIVALGNSEDATEGLIKSINSDKIKIIHTIWNEDLREGGKVLADETNKAFGAVSPLADWAFYIQADEVVHEQYLDVIKASMLKWKEHKEVEGLLLNYKHFYGSYDYVGDSRRWYRKEIRIIRNNNNIHSFRDAQGFRIQNKLLKVKSTEAYMYHYGWVKPPEKQQDKQKYFHKLWHNDNWLEENIADVDTFDYSKIDSLSLYTGTHPEVMKERIKQKNWTFNFAPAQKKLCFKNKCLYLIEKTTGYRIGEYKNYRLV